MEDEQIGPHFLGELRCREVILHVRESDARRDAGRPGACSEQRGFGHAPRLAALQAHRGAEALVQSEVLERVVAHAIAHRVVEGHGALQIARALAMLGRKSRDRGVRAVDEARGLQVFLHLSSFMSRLAPAKSALVGSASASMTEKWFFPGIATSPKKGPRQRSRSRAFCLRNSDDSAPPTLVITGARVAGGRNAGDSRSADSSSRRRSCWRNGTERSGRRS